MRILLVGEFGAGHLSNIIQTNMEKQGHKVTPFEYRRFKSMEFNVVMRRLPDVISGPVRGFFNVDYITNLLLLRAVKKTRPDCIFVVKGENVFPRTLIKIKKRFPKTIIANWNGDNPFVMWNSSLEHIASLRLYDVLFIWGRFLIPVFKSVGAKRVEYVPFGFEPGYMEYKGEISSEEREKYSCDVLFVGAWWHDRERILGRLSEFNIKIWGHHWMRKVSKGSKLRDHIQGGPIFGEELGKAFRCSKIILNFLRTQNLDANNMRTFEVPGSGNFLLTTRSREQCEELFKEGADLAAFSSPEELKDKIRYYLKNAEEREMIAEHGRKTALKKHTYAVRVKYMMNVIGEERMALVKKVR